MSNGLRFTSNIEIGNSDLPLTDMLTQPSLPGQILRFSSAVAYEFDTGTGVRRAQRMIEEVTGGSIIAGTTSHRGAVVDPPDSPLNGRRALDLAEYGSNAGSYYRLGNSQLPIYGGLEGFTCFFVISHLAADSSFPRRLLTITPSGGGVASNSFVVVFVQTTGNGAAYELRARHHTEDSHAIGTSPDPAVPTTPAIYSLTLDPPGGEAIFRRNGVEIIALDNVPVRSTTGSITSGMFSVGGGNYGSGAPGFYGAGGVFGDFAAYNRVLELAEIQTIEAYFAGLYGISI